MALQKHRSRENSSAGARETPSQARERRMVARAIEAAIRQIARYDPELAETLKTELKSGKTLSYQPRPK